MYSRVIRELPSTSLCICVSRSECRVVQLVVHIYFYNIFLQVYKNASFCCRGTRRIASRHRIGPILPTATYSRVGAGGSRKRRARSYDAPITGYGDANVRCTGARSRRRSVLRVQEVQGGVCRGSAAPDPSTPVLQRQPGQQRSVPDRPDRLRLQTVRRSRTLQDTSGIEATLRRREPSEIR